MKKPQDDECFINKIWKGLRFLCIYTYNDIINFVDCEVVAEDCESGMMVGIHLQSSGSTESFSP
jgi:hypothetical protein